MRWDPMLSATIDFESAMIDQKLLGLLSNSLNSLYMCNTFTSAILIEFFDFRITIPPEKFEGGFIFVEQWNFFVGD